MPVHLSQLADFCIAECTGEMTVENIAQIQSQFEALICGDATNIMVDVSQVTDFDSSALQFLLWLKSHLAGHYQLQFIVAENAVVSRVLSLYQLSEQLVSIHDSSAEES
ncbi:STAS domain-containing protein [Vibrio alginolyticus]